MANDSGGLVQVLNALWGGATTSIIGATVGRLMWHSLEAKAKRRRFFGPEALWEIPVILGMVIIGEGAAAYFGWEGPMKTGLIAVMAYLGPRGTEALLDRWFAARKGE